MKYYFCNFYSNCGDEFDVTGFRLFTEDEYNEYKEIINKLINLSEYENEITCAFGTNEYLYFDSWEDYNSSFRFKEITEEEYKSIENVIGKHHGYFPDELAYEVVYDLGLV